MSKSNSKSALTIFDKLTHHILLPVKQIKLPHYFVTGDVAQFATTYISDLSFVSWPNLVIFNAEY